MAAGDKTPELRLFIPITKVDAASRTVYGTVTAEELDHSGEVFDYETSKPYFEKWSAEISEATDGKSVGNLRAAHSMKVAGKLTQLAFDDDAKRIECVAKVLDDDEWEKVIEGAYTGFSQGGRYINRWMDANKTRRFTAAPFEVSLVDVPCSPSARMQYVKADGTTEDIPFKSSTEAQAEEKDLPNTDPPAATPPAPEKESDTTPASSPAPTPSATSGAGDTPPVIEKGQRMSQLKLGDMTLDLQKAGLPSDATALDFVNAAYGSFDENKELKAENQKLLDMLKGYRDATTKLKEAEAEALIKGAIADDKIDVADEPFYKALYASDSVLCVDRIKKLPSRKYLKIRQSLGGAVTEVPRDPKAELAAAVAAIRATDKDITEAAAVMKAYEADPDLYQRVTKARQAAAGGDGGAR